MAKPLDPDIEELADRVRRHLVDDPNVSERRMFGGICFMLNGNMLCGSSKTGNLMLRVGKELEEEALRLPATRKVEMNGRKMGGFIYVSPEGHSTERELAEWIAFATRFVGALPPK